MTTREPKVWTVVKDDGRYYIKDLLGDYAKYKLENGHSLKIDELDSMLLYRDFESECGDVYNPSTPKRMLGALYDMFQCNDELKDGDEFRTPHGRYLCIGVHVVPLRNIGTRGAPNWVRS